MCLEGEFAKTSTPLWKNYFSVVIRLWRINLEVNLDVLKVVSSQLVLSHIVSTHILDKLQPAAVVVCRLWKGKRDERQLRVRRRSRSDLGRGWRSWGFGLHSWAEPTSPTLPTGLSYIIQLCGLESSGGRERQSFFIKHYNYCSQYLQFPNYRYPVQLASGIWVLLGLKTEL